MRNGTTSLIAVLTMALVLIAAGGNRQSEGSRQPEGGRQLAADSGEEVDGPQSTVDGTGGWKASGPEELVHETEEPAPVETTVILTGPGQPEPPRPQGPLFERYVVEANPAPAPTLQEIVGERQNRAGSTARFLVEGSRANESEAYRSELRALPLGRTWDWYRDQLLAQGFSFRDATFGPRDRPRYCVVKNRIQFRLEIALDSRGRVKELQVDPNL